ncbi:hypothetical protein DPMN_044576 [Dreissena polymorpha]|uniref:Uncharacterized protein n=1 Tax=Dreissena polymorpha TaxID=45954 RepID=A0A9D4D4P1_DREPO|nr:hypothetical protein DPMN_044576 [Dreissena polymorpha]
MCDGGAPAGHSQTVYDGFKIVPDCARQSPRPPEYLQETLRQSATMPRPSWYLQETPRRCKTISQTVGAPARDSLTVCDGGKDRVGAGRRLAHGSRQYARPSGNKQQTPRHQPEISRQSPGPVGHLHGFKDSLRCCQVRLGTCNKLQDSLRRCRNRLGTCRFQSSLRRSERLPGTVTDCLGNS